jgi:bifunctional DNA-binding transcriptional regulator/antitoxin component of YhaV-PrlF toxin-antitoxin module
MAIVHGKVVEGGRLIVPAAFRKEMGIDKGDTVVMELHGDELRVRPAKSALRRLQERLRSAVPEGVSIADELIDERRLEASRE